MTHVVVMEFVVSRIVPVLIGFAAAFVLFVLTLFCLALADWVGYTTRHRRWRRK